MIDGQSWQLTATPAAFWGLPRAALLSQGLAKMASGETQAAEEAAMQEELDADFAAGFEGATGTTETPTADGSTTEKAVAATTTEQEAQAIETPPGPKKVEIDEAELDALRKLAAAGDGHREQLTGIQKKFDQVFGKVGSLEQLVSKLRTETPAGEKVEVSEADFQDLVDAYPEIGKLTAQGLNKAMAKVKGSGGADSEAINKIVTERVQAEIEGKMTSQVTDTVLNAIVPRWRQQVNTQAFDAWLKAQKSEVQALAGSDDVGDAAEMLRRYRRYMEKPAATPAPTAAPAPQRGATRRQQIAAAVTPKGDGTATSAAPAPQRGATRRQQIAAAVTPKGDGTATSAARGDEDDDFEAGFKAGKV